MKTLMVSIVVMLMTISSTLFAFYNINDAQWKGDGVISYGGVSYKVMANFSILATSDVASEKMINGAFINKEFGIQSFDFWAFFSDKNNFKTLVSVEKWYGQGFDEDGEGSCVYKTDSGDICRYNRQLANGSVISETLTFQKNGDLLRDGAAVLEGNRLSYKLLLHPFTHQHQNEPVIVEEGASKVDPVNPLSVK